MNLRAGPHHNILKGSLLKLRGANAGAKASGSAREDGYTLVALLAVMTMIALFAMAAAPAIRQQAQREREIEAIFRGEEVADAIGRYYAYQVGRRNAAGDAGLPTSIDQLLEGVSVGTKKVQVLRASAARDPLSETGEWTLVRPRSSRLADFTRSIMLFADNVRPVTHNPQLKQAERDMAPVVVPTLGLASSGLTSGGLDSFSSGPFIGVTPSSDRNSIINYYGIEHHNEWVFTPLFR